MGRAADERTGRERLATPVFVLIVCATLATFLVGQGTNAGTSVYLERTGGAVWLAGIGALCFSLAAAIARLISGPLADARTRRGVILGGTAIMLAGCLLPLLDNDGVAFIAWRLLQGAGFSAATTALATAAADVLPATRLGEGIGYYGLGQAISMAIGPALAIFLVSTDPPSNFYLGCAACALVALVAGILIRYERDPSTLPASCGYRCRTEHPAHCAGNPSKGHDHGIDAPAPRGIARIFEARALHGAIPVAFMCAAFSFNIFYMGVLGSSLEVPNPGLYYTICAIAMIAVRLGAGRFMDRTAPLAIMAVAALAGIVAFALLLVACLLPATEASSILFLSAGVPFGLCMGLGIPVNQTIAVRMSPASRWGAANGLFQLAIDIANGVLSLLWGLLANAWGFGIVCACIMTMLGMSIVAAALAYPKADQASSTR